MEAVGGSACGKCGRTIHEGRAACLYCGWSRETAPDEGMAPRPSSPPTAPDPCTFRPGATTVRFLIWSLVAGGVAAWLWSRRDTLRFRGWDDRILPLLCAALVVLGPVAFLAHLARMALVTVTVDPEKGLILSGRRRIAWEEVESVDYAGARFDPDSVLIRLLLDLIRSLAGPLATSVHFPVKVFIVVIIIAVSCLIPLVAFVSGVLFPVRFLLSPWQPRVVLLLKSGERITWRDLRHETDFVTLVDRRARQGRT